MRWEMSHRADPFARDIADRHYNRQSVGAPQFAPPGRCLVLKTHTHTGIAFWITSWPFGRFVKHRWPGAWMCSAFRNEGAGLATELILEAVASTRAYYGEPPLRGMVTFLDRGKVRPTKVRGVETWGRTWIKAGFEQVGETEGGLMALQLRPSRMPEALAAIGSDDVHRDFRTPYAAAFEHTLADCLSPW